MKLYFILHFYDAVLIWRLMKQIHRRTPRATDDLPIVGTRLTCRFHWIARMKVNGKSSMDTQLSSSSSYNWVHNLKGFVFWFGFVAGYLRSEKNGGGRREREREKRICNFSMHVIYKERERETNVKNLTEVFFKLVRDRCLSNILTHSNMQQVMHPNVKVKNLTEIFFKLVRDRCLSNILTHRNMQQVMHPCLQ